MWSVESKFSVHHSRVWSVETCVCCSILANNGNIVAIFGYASWFWVQNSATSLRFSAFGNFVTLFGCRFSCFPLHNSRVWRVETRFWVRKPKKVTQLPWFWVQNSRVWSVKSCFWVHKPKKVTQLPWFPLHHSRVWSVETCVCCSILANNGNIVAIFGYASWFWVQNSRVWSAKTCVYVVKTIF